MTWKMLGKHKKILVIVVCVAMIALLPGCSDDSGEVAESIVFAMSTYVRFRLEGQGAKQTCAELVEALNAFEARASMHMDGSDVARINEGAGGGPVEVDGEVYAVIAAAAKAAEYTGGLFDITIGPLTSLWDIGADNPSVPQEEDIAAALELVGYSSVTLSSDGGRHGVALERAGQKIDLGGIAKGYALDIFRRLLDRSGVERGVISIGGNVMAYRDKGGEPYIVGIRYPRPNSGESYMCALGLSDGVISTTGGYERFFEQDGAVYHHVIDPRTGYPSDSGLESVSVIRRDGLSADYLSTAMFIGGLEYSLELMRRDGVQAVVIAGGGRVYVTESLRGSLVEELCDREAYSFQSV
jgi:thiamine biosynthesis lipoprotein